MMATNHRPSQSTPVELLVYVYDDFRKLLAACESLPAPPTASDNETAKIRRAGEIAIQKCQPLENALNERMPFLTEALIREAGSESTAELQRLVIGMVRWLLGKLAEPYDMAKDAETKSLYDEWLKGNHSFLGERLERILVQRIESLTSRADLEAKDPGHNWDDALTFVAQMHADLKRKAKTLLPGPAPETEPGVW